MKKLKASHWCTVWQAEFTRIKKTLCMYVSCEIHFFLNLFSSFLFIVFMELSTGKYTEIHYTKLQSFSSFHIDPTDYQKKTKKDYQKADWSNGGMAQKNCIETPFKRRQNVIPTITCVKPAFTWVYCWHLNQIFKFFSISLLCLIALLCNLVCMFSTVNAI